MRTRTHPEGRPRGTTVGRQPAASHTARPPEKPTLETSSLQKCEATKLCCFSPSVCGSLSWQTETTSFKTSRNPTSPCPFPGAGLAPLLGAWRRSRLRCRPGDSPLHPFTPELIPEVQGLHQNALLDAAKSSSSLPAFWSLVLNCLQECNPRPLPAAYPFAEHEARFSCF